MSWEQQLRVTRLNASSRLYRKRAVDRCAPAIPAVPRQKSKIRDEQTPAALSPRSSEGPESPVVDVRSRQLYREKRRRVPAGMGIAKCRNTPATSLLLTTKPIRPRKPYVPRAPAT